jgi:hypothetical protein
MSTDRDAAVGLRELQLEDIDLSDPSPSPDPGAAAAATDPAESPSPAPADPTPPVSSQEATPASTGTTQANTTWTPSGEPLRFTAGGREIAPEGSYVTPEGYVVMPKPYWDNEFAKKYVGPVDDWRSKEAGYQRQVKAIQKQLEETANDPKVQAYEALIHQLMTGDPDEVAAFLDGKRGAMPLVLAEKKAEILEAKLKAIQAQKEAEEYAQREEAADAQLAEAMGQRIQAALKAPEFAMLAGQPDVVQDVMKEFPVLLKAVPGNQAFQLARDGYELIGEGLQGEVIGLHRGALTEALQRRAEPLRKQRADADAAKAAEQRNAAVVKPIAAPIPPKPAARDELGKFVKDPEKPKRRALYDLELDDIE